MFKWVKISAFIFAATFLSLSHAGTRANSLTGTLAGGYERFDSKRHVKNAIVPMGMIGYNFTEHWGVEALLGVINTHSTKRETKNEHVHGYLFAFDGLYHFSDTHQIEPFVLAGVGITNMNRSGSDANDQGNINAGAGLMWFANEAVALRAEIRDFYTITGGKNDVMADIGVTFSMDLC